MRQDFASFTDESKNRWRSCVGIGGCGVWGDAGDCSAASDAADQSGGVYIVPKSNHPWRTSAGANENSGGHKFTRDGAVPRGNAFQIDRLPIRNSAQSRQ